MELSNLSVIVEGLDSLAAIEKEHPELGTALLAFVQRVGACCDQAYSRLSDALGTVRSLPAKPRKGEITAILKILNDAPNSKWFKEVTGICGQLEALIEEFQGPLSNQMQYAMTPSAAREKSVDAERNDAYRKLGALFVMLQHHEGDLKDDMRDVVAKLEAKLGPVKDGGSIESAREYSLRVQKEIASRIDHVKRLCLRIEGTSGGGVRAVLDNAKVAEDAMRAPGRMMVLNMFFVVVLIIVAASIFQILTVPKFLMATAFAITAVTILNAFYLRSIDKLREESFLKLMELALVKFFIPLTRRPGKVDPE